MKAVSFIGNTDLAGLADKVKQLCNASQHVTEEIADAFTLGTFTVTRTLNPATATATQVANVLATLIHDLQQRGTSNLV